MSYRLFVLLLLVALSLSVQGKKNAAKRGVPTFSVITTGRGVIAGLQVGSKWELREVPYGTTTGQWWYINSSWENMDSYFIGISDPYWSLVWDAQGYKFVSGTPIVVYERKDDLVATKNQRWFLNGDHIAIVYDSTMVANVSESGKVVLAKKTSSPYQKFKIFNSYEERSFTFFNFHVGPVTVSLATPVGPMDSVVASEQRANFKLFPGSIITVKDLNGTVLSPSPYDVTDLSSFRVPALVLPVGQRTWSGQITTNQTYATSFSISVTSGDIKGSGSSVYGGAFNVSGDCYQGGDFQMIFLYSNKDDDVLSGLFGATGTTMAGSWSRAWNNYGTFQFTLQ